jgi:hypothetical protein|tara:strand:- start:153 stop:956 length:804 start_codon:yes stop_codon:yes gene_type:complete
MAILGPDGRPVEETVAEQEERKNRKNTGAQQTQQQRQAQNRIEFEKTERAQAKIREQQRLAARGLGQRALSGLLSAGRFALTRSPYGLLAYGGYKGLENLGVFGNNEVQPQPTVTATPVGVQEQQEPSARFSQVISPTTSATSKEVLNAALLRAGLSLLQGGSAKEALTAASTVSEARTKFRTGAQALAEGQKNLGSTATIYVSQNKDGTYSYSGRTDANATDILGKIISQSQKKITNEVLESAKKANPNLSDEQVISELKKVGYTE